MKILTNKEILNNAVQLVQRAVSIKNPLPILAGIKFETRENQVILTATDLDIGIRCSFPAEVIVQGTTVLPAKYICELFRRLPELPIFIEADAATGSVTIQYGQSETRINGYPPEEFPELPLPEGINSFTLPGELLKEIIRQVVFATGNDENRPVFMGVLFEINGSELQVVATDTYRLAWRKVIIENCEETAINLIIPGKTLNELLKIIGINEQIEVTVTKNQILFVAGNVWLISRLIEGNFPKYKQVIPQNHILKVRLKTRDLLDATERASLLAQVKSPVIKLNISENKIIVSSYSEAGRVHEELDVYQEGETLQIAFNAQYLGDVLKVIGSEEIIIELTGPLSPGIIKPVGDNEYLSLLLPVRLREE
ncbi:MAG: DNA polymerase III subunit beta [Pelotomaculaceae bacterium]|jgi:DNA polymerase-3 subunit beta|nr:DNA polymerase III subunit beta [Bacillota bacterium]HHU86720.1 DNA polymerase III subunit beta [Peptococcaceae bacterium]